MKIPTFSRKLREYERRIKTLLTADQFEAEAEVGFREARRTGSAAYDAHGRIAKLHAERIRRGLPSIEALPADVLRQWDWEGAAATVRAHVRS